MVTTLTALAIGAALGGLLWWLLRKLGKKAKESRRREHEEIQRMAQSAAEAQQQIRTRARAATEARVRDILEDEQLALLAGRLAGIEVGVHQSRDDDLIRRLADRLNPQLLNVLSAAKRTNEQVEAIEVQSTKELRETECPADMFEIERMQSLDQLAQVLPEELAMQDDIFYATLQDESLHVTRHYEFVQHLRRVYILLDISTSMDGAMSGGGSRIQWAAGVALKLMLRAQRGEAEYMLRFFNAAVGELHSATSPEEARQLADTLVKLGTRGGTDISGALKTAVSDIRSSKSEADTSDVLLITDGEDNALKRPWLRKTFGDQIRLHVAMIGKENAVLKDNATSYEVYR